MQRPHSSVAIGRIYSLRDLEDHVVMTFVGDLQSMGVSRREAKRDARDGGISSPNVLAENGRTYV